MGKRICFFLSVLVICLLSGCTLPTVEQMYCLPKRPDSYNDLQRVMDGAMVDMEYCAPRAGENQQTVQMADLDGDGVREYLLFARNVGDKSLRILVFAQNAGSYCLINTLQCSGITFDRVAYVQMDDADGVELIVGCQLNQQVQGIVSVYRFQTSEPEQLLSTGYTAFQTVDLDNNDLQELLVFHPGEENDGKGTVNLYGIRDKRMQANRLQSLSAPVDTLQRVITGHLSDGSAAVFCSCVLEDGSVVTDIYSLDNGEFISVIPSGAVMAPVSGGIAYPADIDGDGVVELPEGIPSESLDPGQTQEQYLICWNAISLQAEKTDKLHTCYNGDDGWYLELDPQWSYRISVSREGNAFRFYLWDEQFETAQEVFSVLALTGQDREQMAVQNNRFAVFKDETVIYAARLEVASGILSIGQEDLMESFHRIRQAWRTGEI